MYCQQVWRSHLRKFINTLGNPETRCGTERLIYPTSSFIATSVWIILRSFKVNKWRQYTFPVLKVEFTHCWNFKNDFYFFRWWFLASPSLRWCMGFSPVAVSSGCSLVAVLRPLIAVASLTVEHGQALGWPASVVAAHRLSSCGLWAPESGPSSCGAWVQLLMWDLLGPGIQPMFIDRWILNHWTTRKALS